MQHYLVTLFIISSWYIREDTATLRVQSVGRSMSVVCICAGMIIYVNWVKARGGYVQLPPARRFLQSGLRTRGGVCYLI